MPGREAARAVADFARAVEHVPDWPSATPRAAAAGPDPNPAGFAAPAASQHPVWGAARGGNAARASLLLVLLRAEAERLAVRLVCPSPKVSHFSGAALLAGAGMRWD